MTHDWQPDDDMLRCTRCGVRANEAGTRFLPECRPAREVEHVVGRYMFSQPGVSEPLKVRFPIHEDWSDWS